MSVAASTPQNCCCKQPSITDWLGELFVRVVVSSSVQRIIRTYSNSRQNAQTDCDAAFSTYTVLRKAVPLLPLPSSWILLTIIPRDAMRKRDTSRRLVSVRPSVRLSHSCMVSKRQSSNFYRGLVSCRSSFLSKSGATHFQGNSVCGGH